MSLVVHQDDRFRIPDRFTLMPIGPDQYRLHSLTFSLALRGRSHEFLSRLLPLIDGERTVSQLVTALQPFDEEAVHDALEGLLEAGVLERTGAEENGLLSPSERRRLRSQIAFFSHFVVPPGTTSADQWPGIPRSGLEYQERIKQAHVVVVGLGRLGSHLVRSLAFAGLGTLTLVDTEPIGETDLAADGWFTSAYHGRSRADAASDLIAAVDPAVSVRVAREPADVGGWQALLAEAHFAVLCPDAFNPAEYDIVNRAALASKTSWTSARLSGFELQMGPTIVPYETACYECFNLRQKSNVPDIAEYQLVEQFQRTNRLSSDWLAFTPGAGLLALEVLKAITWFMPPAGYAHLYSLNLLTMESKRHPVLKIPRCPACGRPAQPRPTIRAWQQSTVELVP